MIASTSARVGALLLLAVPALAHLTGTPPATITTTIPYSGLTTETITKTPCGGPTIVIVKTPTTVPVSSTTVCNDTETTTTVPTTSSASTATSTPALPTGACAANLLCKPLGLNIDYYNNAFGGYSSGNTPSSYYLTEGLKPLDSGLTNATFFAQNYGAPSGTPAIYPDPKLPTAPYFVGWTRDTNGGVTVDANNFTVVYQGFYRAPATGTYTLCATADNQNDVYFGDGNALSCLDGSAPANAAPLLTTTGGSYINTPVCKTFDLAAGFFYPVRNVMGNWQGPSAFNFTIQVPGATASQEAHDFTGLVYPTTCGIFL